MSGCKVADGNGIMLVRILMFILSFFACELISLLFPLVYYIIPTCEASLGSERLFSITSDWSIIMGGHKKMPQLYSRFDWYLSLIDTLKS